MTHLVLLFLAGAMAAPQETIPPPVAYAMEATLDEGAHRLRGHERIEYRHQVGGRLERLYLQLFPNSFRNAGTTFARQHARLPWSMNPLEWIPWGRRRGFVTIESVEIGGRAVAFTVEETVLVIPLGIPLDTGQVVTIDIAFEVKLPLLQLVLGYRGTNYSLALWFPKLAVPDSSGWRGDRPPSESDFYADLGEYDVRLTVPAGLVVAATGELESTTDNGDGTMTRRWRAGQVRYFAWVADRRYQVKRVTRNDVSVEYLYVGKDDSSLARGVAIVGEALAFYGARYGRYPHRSLVIAEMPALGSGIGGVAFSQLIMIPAGLRQSVLSRPMYQAALAHEIAHQWWGMAVGVRAEEDGWLNEALAEFSASDLARSQPARGSRARPVYQLLRRWEYVNQAVFGFDRKIVQPDSGFDDLGALEVARYAKGSFVLRMLQGVVGPGTFDSVLSAYAARYRHRNAGTADFVALAESVSRQDLVWFFDQWLNSTATCDYGIGAVTTKPRPEGGYRSVIELLRNGSIAMPVEIVVTLDDGSVLRQAWDGRERSHQIAIDSGARVRSVVLDPDGYLLETARFNNYYPARVRSSFLPRIAEDDAYRVVHLPFVVYDGGVEPGVLLAGGRAPRVVPPDLAEPEHRALAVARYNLATRTAAVKLGYSGWVRWPVARTTWGVSASRDRRHEMAAVNAQALFGPHFFRPPFHALGLSLEHERVFATNREIELGTVNSVELSYGLRALVTDFYPIRGGALAVVAEAGGRGAGWDSTFLRVAGQADFYRRVFGGTKLAVNLFAGTIAAGLAPRQKQFFLSREGNFRAGPFATLTGDRLAAVNAEIRMPVGAGTLLGVAAFIDIATAPGLRREAGVGLRVFDNAPFAVQVDVPFWTSDGTGAEAVNFARFSLRVGRPFRGPGS